MNAADPAPPAPRRRRAPTSRRTVVRSPAEVPQALFAELIGRMAERMCGTPEARRSVGMGLAFTFTDVAMDPARYVIEPEGFVRASFDHEHADFRFHAPASVFDGLLQGKMNPIAAGLHGLRVSGNPLRLRSLARMLPAVQRAYVAERAALIKHHSKRYDFRF